MLVKHRPLGEIFKYNGVRLQVVAKVVDSKDDCRGCYFKKHVHCPLVIIGACTRPWRDEDVIFRKVDKDKTENLHKKNVNK